MTPNLAMHRSVYCGLAACCRPVVSVVEHRASACFRWRPRSNGSFRGLPMTDSYCWPSTATGRTSLHDPLLPVVLQSSGHPRVSLNGRGRTSIEIIMWWHDHQYGRYVALLLRTYSPPRALEAERVARGSVSYPEVALPALGVPSPRVPPAPQRNERPSLLPFWIARASARSRSACHSSSDQVSQPTA